MTWETNHLLREGKVQYQGSRAEEGMGEFLSKLESRRASWPQSERAALGNWMLNSSAWAGLKNVEQRMLFIFLLSFFLPSLTVIWWDVFSMKKEEFSDIFILKLFFSEENEHRPQSLPCHSGQFAAKRWWTANANDRSYPSLRKHLACKENFPQ